MGYQMQNEFTAKLCKLITEYGNAVVKVQYCLGGYAGKNEQHPIWLELKEAEKALQNELEWLGIQILTLQSENKRLNKFKNMGYALEA